MKPMSVIAILSLILVFNLLSSLSFAEDRTCGWHRSRSTQCIGVEILKSRPYAGPLVYNQSPYSLEHTAYDEILIRISGTSPGKYYFGEKGGQTVFGFSSPSEFSTAITSPNLAALTDIIGPPGKIYYGYVRDEMPIQKSSELWKVLSEADAQKKTLQVTNEIIASEVIMGVFDQDKMLRCHHEVHVALRPVQISGVNLSYKKKSDHSFAAFNIKHGIELEACEKLLKSW